ncbi:unnamed protein product [Phytomonas sp. Hart1]|nr:unnamed protein product [Phytomonas sp. Hart1]|eukprot:CCW66318.1 unnamed protein product [Phytomonas sp. isolate Hart1]
MFSQSLASYSLLGCVVSAAQFAGGELSFYETSLQLLAEDGCGQWTSTLTLPYDYLIHLRVVREKGFMRISTLRAPVIRWAEDNSFISQLDVDDNEDLRDDKKGNGAGSYGVSHEKPRQSLPPSGGECVLLFQLSREDMANFMTNIAPMVAARERMRSASRISITEPLPTGCPFEDPGGDLEDEDTSKDDINNNSNNNFYSNSNENSSGNHESPQQTDKTTLLKGAEEVNGLDSGKEKSASRARSHCENTVETELFPPEIKTNQENKEGFLDGTFSDQLAQFEEEAIQARADGFSGRFLRTRKAPDSTGNPPLDRAYSCASGGLRSIDDLGIFDGRKKVNKNVKESSFARRASVATSTAVSIHSKIATPVGRLRERKGLYLPSEGLECNANTLNGRDGPLKGDEKKRNNCNSVDLSSEMAPRNMAVLPPSIADMASDRSREKCSSPCQAIRQDDTFPTREVESVDEQINGKSSTYQEVASSLCVGDILLEQNSFHNAVSKKLRNPPGGNSLSKPKSSPHITSCGINLVSCVVSSKNPQPATTNPPPLVDSKKSVRNGNVNVPNAPDLAYDFSDITTLPQHAELLPFPPPPLPIPPSSAKGGRARQRVSSVMDDLGEILGCLTTRGKRKRGKRTGDIQTTAKRAKVEPMAVIPPPFSADGGGISSSVETPSRRPFPLLLLDDEEVACGQPSPAKKRESPPRITSRGTNTKKTKSKNRKGERGSEGMGAEEGVRYSAANGSKEGSPGEGAAAVRASSPSKSLYVVSFSTPLKINNEVAEEKEENTDVQLEGAYPIKETPSEGGLPFHACSDSVHFHTNLPHTEPPERNLAPAINNNTTLMKTYDDDDDDDNDLLMKKTHQGLRKERLRRAMRCMNFICKHLNLMRESEAELRGIVLSLMDDGQI